jgi:hypothetical protein
MDRTEYMVIAAFFLFIIICGFFAISLDNSLTPIEIVATCAVDGKLYFERDDVTVTCEVVRK